MLRAHTARGKAPWPRPIPPCCPPRTCSTAYAGGTLSPVAVLQAVTERIARRNPALNAFVVLNPRALDAAGESAIRWRAGRPIGPLDGVPVTVKDLVDLARVSRPAAARA